MASDAEPDETATWMLAKTGDRAAFGAVFDRHFDRVLRHALGLMRSEQDAEDVAALVFLEAWRLRERVRVVDGTVLPWLLVTATHVSQNAARTHRRHRIALAKLPLDDRVDDHADAVLTGIGDVDRHTKLRDGFRRLSKNDQDVLTLCVVNDYSLQAAADTLGVPVGTVKSRLSRAKERLAARTGLRPSDDSTLILGGQK